MANIIKTTLGLAGALLLVVGLQHFTASPVVLQASTDAVAGYGEWLELRADGTFDHTSAGLFSQDITRGRYTRTGNLICLDQLPAIRAVKRKTLRVSTSPAFETGKGIWQVGPTGRIDPTLSRFRIVYLK
jgi:hypothetical protein